MTQCKIAFVVFKRINIFCNIKEGFMPLFFCLYMVKPYRMIVSSLPDHTAGNTDIYN